MSYPLRTSIRQAPKASQRAHAARRAAPQLMTDQHQVDRMPARVTPHRMPAFLAVVLVARGVHPNELRDWLQYHLALSIYCVVISNECNDAEHRRLVQATHDARSGMSLRLNSTRHGKFPDVQLLDGFRCSVGFQADAYRAGTQHLWGIAPPPMRSRIYVGFWDADEYLVANASHSRGTSRSIAEWLEATARNHGWWTGPWILPQQLFGTSGWTIPPPPGFVPANYIMRAVDAAAPDTHPAFQVVGVAANHSNQSGAIVREQLRSYIRHHSAFKSICSLVALCGAASPQQMACDAKPTHAFPRLGGKWVHLCMDQGPGPVGGPVGPAWLPPSRVVRLHHYYTKSRAELLAKEQPTTPRADFAHVAKGSPLPLSCTAAEESVLAALSDARDTTLFDELREWDKALADELQASGLIHMQHGSAAGRMDHRQGCGQKGARIPALPPADLPVATISQLADAVKPASSIFVSHMKAAGRAM